jgi:hypothetical protein
LDGWKTQETFRRYFEYLRAAAWDKPRSARAPPGLGILMESSGYKDSAPDGAETFISHLFPNHQRALEHLEEAFQ